MKTNVSSESLRTSSGLIIDFDVLQYVFDRLPAAIIALDANCRITLINSLAVELTGYPSKELLHRPCSMLFKCDRSHHGCIIDTFKKGNENVCRLETTVHRKNNTTVPVRMNTSALFDMDGRFLMGICICQDITNSKTLERERSNILAMISHDLKSSVTAIGGFIQLLSKNGRKTDEDKFRKYLKAMQNETSKVETMTNDFIELSRMQKRTFKLDRKTVSLRKIITDLIDSLEPACRKKSIKIELTCSNDQTQLQADQLALSRAIANLINNALDYSEQGDTITIETHESGSEVTIRCIDRGKGIDPEHLPYIFDPFLRDKDSGESHGFGIGLAVVKAVAEKHGGSVDVQSNPESGTVFSMTLPRNAGSDKS